MLTAALGELELRRWCLALPDAFARLGAPNAMQQKVAALLAAARLAALDDELSKTSACDDTEAAVEAKRAEYKTDAAIALGRAMAERDTEAEEEEKDEATLAAWAKVSGRAALLPTAPWGVAAHALRASRSDAQRQEALQEMGACFAKLASEPDFASPGREVLREQMNRAAWRAIMWLDTHFYGQYFGCHFCAHRPEVTHDALRARLFAWRKYGPSRFDQGDGANVFILRQQAYQAMQTKAPLLLGRYTVDLTVTGLQGCGYVLDGTGKQPRFYEQSPFARAVFDVAAAGRMRLVSLYPIPKDAARMSLLARPQRAR